MSAKKRNVTQERCHPANEQPSGFPLRVRLLLVLVALGVAGATWAAFEFFVWDKAPHKLVGKWAVVEGPQKGATFDFQRDGAMRARLNNKGKEDIVDATIRVEGDKIYSTTKHPLTGQPKTMVLILRTLTDTELVVEDQAGQSMRMERVR